MTSPVGKVAVRVLNDLANRVRFFVKTLPARLRAVGNPKQGGTLDPQEALYRVTAILRLSTQYEFEAITIAVKENLIQNMTGTCEGLRRLILRMETMCNTGGSVALGKLQRSSTSTTLWRSFLQDTVLKIAHEHQIYAMLPGIYFLLLSLVGPNELAVDRSLSASDRIRCSTGFPFVLEKVHLGLSNKSSASERCGAVLDHRALWKFASLDPNSQIEVWDSLPMLFKFKNWEELECGVLETVDL